jgi:hypothetical protein
VLHCVRLKGVIKQHTKEARRAYTHPFMFVPPLGLLLKMPRIGVCAFLQQALSRKR